MSQIHASSFQDYNIIEYPPELLQLPPSFQTVYDVVAKYEPIASTEVKKYCNLSPRTIRQVLRQLFVMGLLEKIPDLKDMRQSHFRIKQH